MSTLMALSGCLGGDGGDGGDGGEDAANSDNDTNEIDWPTDSITVAPAYGAGGGSDAHVRAFTPYLEEVLDVSIQVENIPGAEQMRGLGEAYHADGDGHFIVNGTYPTAAISYHLNPIDEDISQLKLIGSPAISGYTIYANPDYEIEDIQDLGDRYEDGELNNWAGSTGAANHVASIELRDRGDIPWGNFVGYDGSGPTIEALAADEIPAGIAGTTSGAGPVEEGRLDAIAQTSDVRMGVFPDTPTIEEAGLDPVTGGQVRRMYVVSPETPDDLVVEIHDAFYEAWQADEFQTWGEESSGDHLEWIDHEQAQQEWEESFQIDEEIDLDELRR